MKTKIDLSLFFHGAAVVLFLTGIESPLMAGIPNRHGLNVFDGCPYCSGGGLLPDVTGDSAYGEPGPSTDPLGRTVDTPINRSRRMSAGFGGTKPAAPAPLADPITALPVPKVDKAAIPPPVASPANPEATAKAEPPPEIKQGADGYWRVSFANLASFRFVVPPPEAAPKSGSKKDIPENVLSLEGKQVCVSGFMLPIKLEGGLVKEFLLIRSPMMCCYGVRPKPNEWIVVKMKGKGVVPAMDVPLNFYGTLHVGQLYEQNMFAGLYQMDGEKVSAN